MYPCDRTLPSLAAGSAAALFLFVSTLILSDNARAQGLIVGPNEMSPAQPQSIWQNQSKMPAARAGAEPGDAAATLEAIEIALTQASDGATYVWRRGNGRIVGAVRPTSTFRDVDRRMCRHIEMELRLGAIRGAPRG